VRLGDTERADQALADLSEPDRDRREMRIAAAALRLAQHDPAAATAALAPVLDGSALGGWSSWLAEAFLLEAIASELFVSTSTVKTHLRNLDAKLSAHSRAEAVESARALGLLAPSARYH
jgi:regulatory LuxR family protein